MKRTKYLLVANLIALAFFNTIVYCTAHATPLTYQLAGAELAGTFTQDGTITVWNFGYIYPTATYIVGFTPSGLVITETVASPLFGETWNTGDGGIWNPLAHTLSVTNSDQFTLTYQLCAGICSDAPNTYAFDVLDQRAGLRYSGWGYFAQQITAPISQPVQSVPEPSPIWLLTLALAIGLGVSYAKDVLRVFTSGR